MKNIDKLYDKIITTLPVILRMRIKILLLLVPFTIFAQEQEYRFVVEPDQISDYAQTIITLRKNTFAVLSLYKDSLSFEMGDMTGPAQAMKIKLFYFGDSCFLVGSKAAYDTVFSTLHHPVKFNRRLKKRIDYDITVDGLYPFTVVVDLLNPQPYDYRYFSVVARKVIHK